MRLSVIFGGVERTTRPIHTTHPSENSQVVGRGAEQSQPTPFANGLPVLRQINLGRSLLRVALARNPDIRILVLSADLALARKMVRNVKRIIEKHPLTKTLKPEKIDQWGSEKFTVNRKMELRDPSMLAKGITTNLTGTRADIIICDDVEVPKTSDSHGKRESLREKLLELDYILTPMAHSFMSAPLIAGTQFMQVCPVLKSAKISRF